LKYTVLIKEIFPKLTEKLKDNEKYITILVDSLKKTTTFEYD